MSSITKTRGALEIKSISEADLANVQKMLLKDLFSPYRNYKQLPASVSGEYRFQKYVRDIQNKTVEAYSVAGAGFVFIRSQPLLSEVFGLKMGTIEILAKRQEEAFFSILISSGIAMAAKSGYKHLSLYIDSENTPLYSAASTHEFFKTSDQILFLYDHRHSVPIKVIDRFSIRPFQSADLEGALKLSDESFQKNMRFHQDPNLNSSRIPGFYGAWLKSFFSEPSARGYASERAGTLKGFLFGRLDPLFYQVTGIRKIGEGLSAVSSLSKGLYPALWSAAIRDLKREADIYEAQCLAENKEVISILGGLGFEEVKKQSVMHLYLGER